MPDLQQRTTELLQRLIQFNTVNPPGNEQAAQEFLKEMLEGAGFSCELLAAVEGRPNLVARLRGPSDGPSLCFLGHVDTVLADAADWSVDPWSGELRDDCVWGRGALDMKSQVAAEIAAACSLAEEGWRPESGELLVIVTADEEAGAIQGAKWLCEQMPDRVRCDMVVNEGGGDSFEFGGKRRYLVEVAEKGVFRFTLTTHGSAGHASIPRIGDNALTKLAPIIEALSGGRPVVSRSEESDALVRALGLEPDSAVAELERSDPRLAVLVEPTLGVTFAPTMVSASEKINVIPARAKLQVDCRVPPGLGEDHVRAALGELLDGNGFDGDGFDVTFGESVVGNASPLESPLMEHIRSFVAGEDPEASLAPFVMPGFTDSRWFREAFPECVAYGFFPQRTMDMFEAAPLIHGKDERIPVDDLGLAARFFSGLAQEVLG
jgi:acetylornithine deacetylase/succinyl-diaminopimelate desuccinylase-like protein